MLATMNDRSSHDRPPDAAAVAALWQLIMGFRATQLVHVAAKLGLADHLKTPQTAHQLAQLVGADADALHRILRALASLGIFTEGPDGAFALTPLAQLLRSDAPGSLRATAEIYGEDWLWRAYGSLSHSARTGRPAFAEVHGQRLYEYLRDHPVAAAQFHAAMSEFSAQDAAAVLAAYDFANIGTVVDVGGGQGTLVAALLQAHPGLSGVVFDLGPAVEEARGHLAAAGLAGRATAVAGDFFAEVPRDGDLYLLKNVLHNWDDDAVVRILRTCRRAMSDRARLMAIERVIPAGNAPSEAKLFDINMLVVVGGRARSEAEYRRLFAAARLSLTRVIPTAAAVSLVEGVVAAAT
jgi:O-methyltransferase domain/Dimerisation domain